jgi:membrane protease YdiL (CAAX protease family)
MKAFGNYKQKLAKKDIIDPLFIILVSIFTVTLMYQITLIQNPDPALEQLGMMALGFLGFTTGAGFLSLLVVNSGIIETLYVGPKVDRTMGTQVHFSVTQDKTFASDVNWLIGALFAQLGFSLVYGTFTGSVFDLSFTWDMNTLLLPINAGVAEELVFTFFLSALLLSLSTERWHIVLGGFINMGAFILVHHVVYGANWDALFYIIFLRGLYFLLYFQTRRASFPILLHVLNNFLFIKSILFI